MDLRKKTCTLLMQVRRNDLIHYDQATNYAADNVSISSFNASGDVPPPRCFPTLVSIRNFALRE